MARGNVFVSGQHPSAEPYGQLVEPLELSYCALVLQKPTCGISLSAHAYRRSITVIVDCADFEHAECYRTAAASLNMSMHVAQAWRIDAIASTA